MQAEEAIQAAVILRPGKIEMQSFPQPEIPEDALLIKVDATGVCGTDKHAYLGH